MKGKAEKIAEQLKELVDELKIHFNGIGDISEKKLQLQTIEKSILEFQKKNIRVPDELRHLKINITLQIEKFEEAIYMVRYLQKELNHSIVDLGNLDIKGTSYKRIKSSKTRKISDDKSGYQKLITPLAENKKYTNEEIVTQILKDKIYISFRSVVHKKRENERLAQDILLNNLGKLNKEKLQRIFDLVDEPYLPEFDTRPWFGNLMNKPNTETLLNSTDIVINRWFDNLFNESLPIEERIYDLVAKNSIYNIKGSKVGLASLMLYLSDKTKYSIWFEALHNGLKIFYPSLEKFPTSPTKKTGQLYTSFNKHSKELLIKYNFQNTECDCLLNYIYKMIKTPYVFLEKLHK
jgi:hypothetical protein